MNDFTETTSFDFMIAYAFNCFLVNGTVSSAFHTGRSGGREGGREGVHGVPACTVLLIHKYSIVAGTIFFKKGNPRKTKHKRKWQLAKQHASRVITMSHSDES